MESPKQTHESPPLKSEDVRFNMTPYEAFKTIAEQTSPDFSPLFIGLFLLILYFNESHFAYTSIVVGSWLVIQILFYTIKEDFRNDLFWSIFSLVGNILFYLFIGYCWSMAKLYIDLWQGNLNVTLMDRARVCVSPQGPEGCLIAFLLDMKWNIIRWMTTWPLSVIHTLSRDPLKIITEVIFKWSQQRYLSIIKAALVAHDDLSSTTPLWYYLVGLLAYFIVGFIWTHVKLFVDVWQGSLPPTLDAEVQDIFIRKEAGYLNFVLKIKWLVMQWMITWPVSILYTLLRHPFRILADFIYHLTQRKYVWIVEKAMDTRMTK